MPNRRWLFLAIRIIIGGLFIYASIYKIMNPLAFAKIIHNYRLVPPDLINSMAIILPWIELISGVCLIVGFKFRGANLLIISMLVVFIIALSVSYARGININCGCFSSAANVKSNLLARIIEDVLMLLGCIIISRGNGQSITNSANC